MQGMEEDEEGNFLITLRIGIIGAIVCFIIGFIAGLTL